MRETSFKAVFSDAKAVQDLFKALTSVAREADITIAHEGLAIKSYNGGESAMFSLTIPKAPEKEEPNNVKPDQSSNCKRERRTEVNRTS